MPEIITMSLSRSTTPRLLPGLFPDPSNVDRLSIAVSAAEAPISLDVLKKFLISETKMYMVNFVRFATVKQIKTVECQIMEVSKRE